MNSLAENKTKLTNLAFLRDLADGSNDFIKEILVMFINEMPDSAEQMKSSCNSKDWDTLKAIAHKMKPSLSFIGMEELQKDIQLIERSASERSGLEKLPALVSKSQLVINQAVEELRDELQNINC